MKKSESRDSAYRSRDTINPRVVVLLAGKSGIPSARAGGI